MTTHTVPGRHHIPMKKTAVTLTGIGLALGAAYGVTTLASDGGSIQAPAQGNERVVNPGEVRDPSLERLRPDSAPAGGGVRDSWMPAGATDQKREQLR